MKAMSCSPNLHKCQILNFKLVNILRAFNFFWWILNCFLPNFLRLISMKIDVKGRELSKPIWLLGCPIKGHFRFKNAFRYLSNQNFEVCCNCVHLSAICYNMGAWKDKIFMPKLIFLKIFTTFAVSFRLRQDAATIYFLNFLWSFVHTVLT